MSSKKVIIVGASGVLGKAIGECLQENSYELIPVSRKAKISVDCTSQTSIQQMYQKIKSFDAVICTFGSPVFEPFEKLQKEDYLKSFQDKLLGQIFIVQEGLKTLSGKNASFILTSGILASRPLFTSNVATTIGGALESFVRSAAFETQSRINIVSPTIVKESIDLYPSLEELFEGFPIASVKDVAKVYLDTLQGTETGAVFKSGW